MTIIDFGRLSLIRPAAGHQVPGNIESTDTELVGSRRFELPPVSFTCQADDHARCCQQAWGCHCSCHDPSVA